MDAPQPSIRVLHFFMDGRIGGPSIRALAVARGLRPHQVESQFVVPKRGDFKHLLSDEGFACHEVVCHGLKTPRRVGANLLWAVSFPLTVLQVLRLIRRERVDIVHVNGLMALQGGVAAVLARRKIVWHLSSSLYPRALVRCVMGFVTRAADSIVIISEGIREYHFGQSSSSDDRVTVVQECIDARALDPANATPELVEKMRQRLGLASDDRVVGQVGNVNPIKGYEHFLRLAGELAREHANAHFVIAGALLETQQQYLTVLRKLIEDLGIEDRVTFLGKISQSELPVLLSLMDVFVMTSLAEGGPRVTLEAMAMQTPVIATDVGDVRHQIEDGKHGFVIAVGDWKQGSEIASRLLADPGLSRTIGLAARSRVEDEFDESVAINRHLAIYRKLAETGKSR